MNPATIRVTATRPAPPLPKSALTQAGFRELAREDLKARYLFLRDSSRSEQVLSEPKETPR
jgi:hypothetical protein